MYRNHSLIILVCRLTILALNVIKLNQTRNSIRACQDYQRHLRVLIWINIRLQQWTHQMLSQVVLISTRLLSNLAAFLFIMMFWTHPKAPTWKQTRPLSLRTRSRFNLKTITLIRTRSKYRFINWQRVINKRNKKPKMRVKCRLVPVRRL